MVGKSEAVATFSRGRPGQGALRLADVGATGQQRRAVADRDRLGQLRDAGHDRAASDALPG